MTLAEQRGSVPPDGQLLPVALVVMVEVSTVFAGTGLSTVTVPVTITVPATGMFPVHETPVPVMVGVPEVAVWFPSTAA